jgi:homoaconitase/3-isopropylmalate dehydratase large subunit
MNREKAIRSVFYQALTNANMQITIDDIVYQVPVYDSKMETDDQIYVVISNQFSIRNATLQAKQWRSTIEIDIYQSQQNSATNDFIDDIGELIEGVITPGNREGISGLPDVSGWLITNVFVNSVSNIRLKNFKDNAAVVVNKNIQFQLLITKLF